jgi:hypothetical protein
MTIEYGIKNPDKKQTPDIDQEDIPEEQQLIISINGNKEAIYGQT